ncbi:hypothetical protein ACFOY4_37505 [Actinomadura syzygii]|uniref:Uncharacterized protein n=1 Tax=Actinomadura syzygii TaxID=1427538 RepID=A0A5D0U6K5_9ACTN|nr:hypothetical protein [Actinomadura syzygii]TYC13252.1 hypothetical protein FXF65_22405 [Actinomadura syzygii]
MTARLSPIRLGTGLAALAMAVTLTGCGGSDDKTSASPAGGGAGESMQAFQECLKKQGVQMPQGGGRGPEGGPPSGRPSQGVPTGAPSGRPTGRPSGGPGGGMRSLPPEQRKAFEACASLRPSPRNGQGPGGGQGPGNADAMAAFRDCMAKNGAEIPENTRPSDLKTADPKIAKALKTCQPLLPRRSGSPTPGT